MCKVNGSTLRPNEVTMNGTRCDIRLAMNATSRQPIELGDRHLALELLRRLQRRLQLGAAIEGVGPLASLHFGELANDGEALRRSEGGNGGPLSLEAQAGATLLLGGDAMIGDKGLHNRPH